MSELMHSSARGEEAPHQSLTSGSIHIWFVGGDDIDDPELLRRSMSDLTALEIARAERFVKREARHHFIVGRWMLRHLLSSYSLCVPREITFAVSQHGRPELAGPNRQRIHFNLSHTSGLVACAFTSGTSIGIDVERVQQASFDMDVARSYFSDAACRDILHGSLDVRTERFLEYWVLTEAYAKARGTGLEHTEGSFVFAHSDRSRICFIPPQATTQTAWNFWLAAPTPGYRMAVALAASPSKPPLLRRLRPDGSYNEAFRTLASTDAFQSI